MKTVITLTTIPSRLSDNGDQGLKLCIKSLVNQNYDDYEIHFNIPHVNKTTNKEYIIPNWLLEYTKIKIFRTDDLGPVTKSAPTIERLTDPEDILIVLDDDLVYHPDTVKEHINNQMKWPEYCVGYDGMRSRDESGSFSTHYKHVRDYYYTSNHRNSRVDILQHYKSVSYKRRFFEDDFFDFIKKNYSWNDDLLMSGYMSYKKRVRYVTYYQDDEELSNEGWEKRGGVTTFPVLRHTHHNGYEGCNIFRETKINDNGSVLYKFIDNGYNVN